MKNHDPNFLRLHRCPPKFATRHPTFDTFREYINHSNRAILSWRFLHPSCTIGEKLHTAALLGEQKTRASAVQDDLGATALLNPFYTLGAPVRSIPRHHESMCILMGTVILIIINLIIVAICSHLSAHYNHYILSFDI